MGINNVCSHLLASVSWTLGFQIVMRKAKEWPSFFLKHGKKTGSNVAAFSEKKTKKQK